jgi:hypothetical protein
MILMRTNPPLEGVGPENRDCLVPGMATSETHIHKITNVQYGTFFIWCLNLMTLMGADPLLGPLKGVGPQNLVF